MKTLTKSPTDNIAFSEYLAMGQPLFIGRGVFIMNELTFCGIILITVGV